MPADLWGAKAATTIGGGEELDFMHFQAGGTGCWPLPSMQLQALWAAEGWGDDFNSLTYLLLLASVVVLYWILPYRARLILIFSSGLIFYGFWRLQFLPILLLSSFVDYWAALRMTDPDGAPTNPVAAGKPDRQSRFAVLFQISDLLRGQCHWAR